MACSNSNINTEVDLENCNKETPNKPRISKDQDRRLNLGCPEVDQKHDEAVFEQCGATSKGEKQGIDDERGRDQESSSKAMQESAMSNQEVKISDQYADQEREDIEKTPRDINEDTNSLEKQRCKANKENQPKEGKLEPESRVNIEPDLNDYQTLQKTFNRGKGLEEKHNHKSDFKRYAAMTSAYSSSKDDSNPPPPNENGTTAVTESDQEDREISLREQRDINTAQRFLGYVICLLFVIVPTYNQAHRGRLINLHEARQHRHLMRQRLGLFNQGHVVDLAAQRRQRQRFRAGIQQGPTVILNRDRPQGCSRCSNRPAEVWCETCRNLFCARCDADHHG